MQGQINRNSDGTWQPGQSGNPSGASKRALTWQRYSDRAQELAERFTTEQIREYGLDDEKRAKDLSFWDGQVIYHMARTIDRRLTITDSGADHVNKEREALIDRIEGKAAQPYVPPPDAPGVNSEQKMLDMALKIAFILHQGVKVKGLTIDQPAKDSHDVDPDSQTTDRPPSGG